MRILWFVIAALCVCADARADDSSTPRHLLAGVRAFKDGRYEEALVELRIVAHASDAPADLAFYLGPTLYKLGRYNEALAAFAASHAMPDALTEFYLGETYYQLQLYRKARALFAALRTRGLGPALDDAAGRYVAAVDAAYRVAPTDVSIDIYLKRGLEWIAHDPVVAAHYLDEARLVEAFALRRHRRAEILDALSSVWNQTGHPQTTIEILAAEPTRSSESSWQLARAYAMIGDATHARPMLEAIVKLRGDRAAEAAVLLAKLSP